MMYPSTASLVIEQPSNPKTSEPLGCVGTVEDDEVAVVVGAVVVSATVVVVVGWVVVVVAAVVVVEVVVVVMGTVVDTASPTPPVHAVNNRNN